MRLRLYKVVIYYHWKKIGAIIDFYFIKCNISTYKFYNFVMLFRLSIKIGVTLNVKNSRITISYLIWAYSEIFLLYNYIFLGILKQIFFLDIYLWIFLMKQDSLKHYYFYGLSLWHVPRYIDFQCRYKAFA